MNHNSTDCRTKEGIAVGLIDGIIAMSRALRRMDVDLTVPINEAFIDLHSDEDVKWLMNVSTLS